jgi:hypothetical protein
MVGLGAVVKLQTVSFVKAFPATSVILFVPVPPFTVTVYTVLGLSGAAGVSVTPPSVLLITEDAMLVVPFCRKTVLPDTEAGFNSSLKNTLTAEFTDTLVAAAAGLVTIIPGGVTSTVLTEPLKIASTQ